MIINTDKYHFLVRIMHWVMAMLLLGMIAIGWYMTGLSKEDPNKNILVGWHKSFGALLLILFFVRITLRLTTKAPPLPETMPLLVRKLSSIGHGILYIFIGIVPLSGYAMSNLYGYGVNMFGIAMPKLFETNKELAAIARKSHELLPYIFLVIIALHVIAVIKHRFFDKKENNILSRML